MLAADAARFSGHPQQATHFLERMTREHPQNSIAPLAAFTLGRIYLSQLGSRRKQPMRSRSRSASRQAVRSPKMAWRVRPRRPSLQASCRLRPRTTVVRRSTAASWGKLAVGALF